MRVITETYHEVRHLERKMARCPGCGKRMRRQRTFTNTFSPFNRDPKTGLPRTYEQVMEHLQELGADWKGKPEWCPECQ